MNTPKLAQFFGPELEKLEEYASDSALIRSARILFFSEVVNHLESAYYESRTDDEGRNRLLVAALMLLTIEAERRVQNGKDTTNQG